MVRDLSDLEHVYVVSDLHLGGREGFQMCPPRSRTRLAKMIRAISTRHEPGRMELIINGDFVDFLAEEPYEALTRVPADAVRKFESIVERNEDVFAALRTLVERGHQLTIAGGNHDVELGLDEVRDVLVGWLGGGVVIADGTALRRGPALIEHGNRYDGWNAVDHGKLRALRSQLSRGEPTFEVPAAPGSRLVVEVMNGLKERYPFVDMLKPENELLIPLLLALDPSLLKEVRQIGLMVAARRHQVSLGTAPREWGFIAAGHEARPEAPWDGEAPALEINRAIETTGALLLEMAETLAEEPAGADDEPGFFERLRRRFVARKLVRAALDILLAFELGTETEQYQSQASRLHGLGARIVVFGHTHLAKWIPSRDHSHLYINTGTWCSTIFLNPEEFVDEPDAGGRVIALLRDLRAGRVEPWTRLDTYAAHLHLLGGDRFEARLLSWNDDGCDVAVRSTVA